MADQEWSSGSHWLRWDPHLHAPGTLRNDGFGDDWDGYFNAIATADPPPIALGITDYFTLRGYKEFQARRPTSLGSVSLIFPNVEMRLTATRRAYTAAIVQLEAFLVERRLPTTVTELTPDHLEAFIVSLTSVAENELAASPMASIRAPTAMLPNSRT